jgi:hypothetical protein
MSPEFQAKPGSGVVNFDFDRFFPHKFWISREFSTEEFKKKFCYKILSVRDKLTDKVELVLIRAFDGGEKEELTRIVFPMNLFEGAAKSLVTDFSERLNASFQEQDYTRATTLIEFKKLTERYGWEMRRLTTEHDQ